MPPEFLSDRIFSIWLGMKVTEFGGTVREEEVITSWLLKIDFSKRQSTLPGPSPQGVKQRETSFGAIEVFTVV